MVRHKVDDDLELGSMAACYQFGELLHAASFVLAQVGVDIVIIGDSVWTTCLAFDDGRGVVLCGGVANNAGVPHVCCAQVADCAQGFGGDGIQGA